MGVMEGNILFLFCKKEKKGFIYRCSQQIKLTVITKNVNTYECMYVCIDVCMYVCTYVRTFVYIRLYCFKLLLYLLFIYKFGSRYQA